MRRATRGYKSPPTDARYELRFIVAAPTAT